MYTRRKSVSLVQSICMSVILLNNFIITRAQYGNEEIRCDNGGRNVEPALCTEIDKCEFRNNQSKERSLTQSRRCSQNGYKEIVCCPLSMRSNVNVSQLSVELARIDCEIIDGVSKTKRGDQKSTILDPRIKGGDLAEKEEFPFVVTLGYQIDKQKPIGPENIVYKCAGSLITFRHVLTAAHCTIDPLIPVEVRLGSTSIVGYTEGLRKMDVLKIIRHPSYKRDEYYFDIAMIVMDGYVRESKNILPICLQRYMSRAVRVPNEEIYAVGWGWTMDVYNLPNKLVNDLRKTRPQKLIDLSTCESRQSLYQESLYLPRGLVEGQLCTFDSDNPETSSDACKGDSGGPLVLKSNGNTYLLGIVSAGNYECNGYGIYTSVYHYLDWIQGTIRANKS